MTKKVIHLESLIQAKLLEQRPDLFGRIQVTWYFRAWVPYWLARLVARLFLRSSAAWIGA
jgi:hypothetical protein